MPLQCDARPHVQTKQPHDHNREMPSLSSIALFFSHCRFSWHKVNGAGRLWGGWHRRVPCDLGALGRLSWEKSPLGDLVCVLAGYFQPEGRKEWWEPTLLPIVALICSGLPWGTAAVSSPGFTLPHSEDAQIILYKVWEEKGEMPVFLLLWSWKRPFHSINSVFLL